MANVGYVNKEVAKMYGIPYSELTPEQKKILHEDSVRRAKLIKEREEAVLKNNLKAFEDEAKMEKVLASIYASCQKEILASVTETIAKVQRLGESGVMLINQHSHGVEDYLSRSESR